MLSCQMIFKTSLQDIKHYLHKFTGFIYCSSIHKSSEEAMCVFGFEYTRIL